MKMAIFDLKMTLEATIPTLASLHRVSGLGNLLDRQNPHLETPAPGRASPYPHQWD
jgi:hypothetical protein